MFHTVKTCGEVEPCPLTKFQMAHRLKILMSSGSKKGTLIYYPFLSKSPDRRSPSRFPTGTPRERDRARSEPGGTRRRTGREVKRKLANGVGSQYSHATFEHGVCNITQADAHTSAASSRLNWSPHRFKWTRTFRGKKKSGFCACAITFRTNYTRLQGIFTSLLIYIFISKALREERSSMFPNSGAPMETDAHSRSLLNISFGVPSHGAFPAGSLHRAPIERDASPPEPLSAISQSPW